MADARNRIHSRDILSTVSLVIGVIGLVAAIPALWLAVRAERRTRERHNVDWQIDFCRHGNLEVLNRGRSTARRVVVYVETSEGLELTSGDPRDMSPAEKWSAELKEHQVRRRGTTFFAHVRVEWQTDLGASREICHTAERSGAIISVDDMQPRTSFNPRLETDSRRSSRLGPAVGQAK